MQHPEEVTPSGIRRGIHEAGLAGRPICVHSSLRSFGRIAGGPEALIETFLKAGCTLVVPTFSDHLYMLKSQPGMRPERNGWTYESPWDRKPSPTQHLVYRTECQDIARGMGKLPAAVLAVPGRVRGDHPLCSFSAVGPLAREITSVQRPNQVYAPFEKLTELNGACVLMGVNLTSLTLLHWSEQLAGRSLFRRWANGPGGKPMMVAYGSCSDGFENLRPALAGLLRTVHVGPSLWTCMQAGALADAAANTMRREPRITHCGNSGCERCNDIIPGGPILANVGN